MLQRAWVVDAHVDALRVRLETARPEPVVLVGAPGVGKTAWVHELACRWTLEKVAARKRVRPFFTVDGPRLIAGNGFSGAWQEQALAVLREAHHAGAILDLGRAADLLNAGKHAFSEQNVAQLITPLLAQRHVALVAEATPEEWARVERLNQSFARLWTVVRVEEPADGQALKILTRVARDLADDHELALRDGCVEAAFGLSRRFWPYGSTLGNTVSFLRRLVASRRHAGATVLDAGAAVDHFSQESGVPVMLLRDEVPLKTGAVSSFLAQRVLGQELAVERCAQVVGLIKAGLTDRKRPMAVLLFSGPTGVGKTQLAKALTEFVFSSPERMVRLDMGEYSGPDALERLLGSGHGAGHLTSAVRRQPFCLLLLDEIEKAHPAVFDALLGVLGEGRLTDVNGAFTDFRNAIIIMTSNLGAGTLRSRVGFAAAGQDGASAYQDMRRHYVAEAERFFRPEFFNRLDDLVVFSSLERSQLDGVLTRELALLATREGLRKNQLALDVTPAAHEHLLQQGLDPRFGARPLKRAIERELVVPVAGFLASHPGMRASRLQVDAAQGTLTLDGRTTGATDHANIRTLTQDMLERASDIRSRVGALRACGLAQRLNDARQFYEKASKQPAFWNERELAEQKTRQHAEARAMLDRLIALQGQAETLEDLAFEAFYDRAADAVKQLSDDVVALERDVLPVTEDLLACMHNPRFRVRLIMTAGRGAWRHMLKLAEGYRLWAGRRELSVTSHVLSETVSTEKDARTGRSTSTRSVRWQQKAWDPAGPVPVAVSMAFAGKPSRFLLAAEHGNHVVLEGGQSTWVKVKVEMVAAHAALPDEAELAERWTCPDIRRVERDKERVKDLSLGTVATMVSGVIRDLDVLLHPWMFQQLGAPEAEPWT
jgi:energy-coupling factor transporter ATP-binding protein EcfA2